MLLTLTLAKAFLNKFIRTIIFIELFLLLQYVVVCTVESVSLFYILTIYLFVCTRR